MKEKDKKYHLHLERRVDGSPQALVELLLNQNIPSSVVL